VNGQEEDELTTVGSKHNRSVLDKRGIYPAMRGALTPGRWHL
jgi:hypothetical protein